MKFFSSPAAFITSVMLAIFVFGIGLTSPIWFLLDGKPPVDAMKAGTPITIVTAIGMVIVLVLGAYARRHQRFDEEAPTDVPSQSMGYRHKDKIVHIVTMAMFIVPFLTIIVGMLLRKVIDGDGL
ncbi:MAG: hypothetical protein F8N37_06865 [Telmatospirillum sp.]|nr:hypothetical protein [Telmatospirillum sp.]